VEDAGGSSTPPTDNDAGSTAGGPFNANPCWDDKCPQQTQACKMHAGCSKVAACIKTEQSADACAKQANLDEAGLKTVSTLLTTIQECGWKLCNDPTKGSCQGQCGKYLGANAPCNCDDACAKYGDCCGDYKKLCSSSGGGTGGADAGGSTGADAGSSGPATTASCGGKCGNYSQGATCQCDSQCSQYGDCCKDFAKACPSVANANAVKCGDGKIGGSEQCDGAELNNLSCQGLGYASGTLKCDAKCSFDKSGCKGLASCASKVPGHACTLGNSACAKIELFSPFDGYGYKVTHGKTYSWLRHDTAMLIKYATASVTCAMPGSFPLGLGDMSMQGGKTPAEANGQLRHPKGTHDYGRDLDIAYYQVGQPNNHLRAICNHKTNAVDQYHCVSAPTILDVPRTTLFIARLMESSRIRVIGVDGKAGPLFVTEAAKLYKAGKISATSYNKFSSHLAFEVTNTNKGWFKFHHHHLHVSTFTTQYPSGNAPPPPPPPATYGRGELPPKVFPIAPPGE
jgi:hypothetical protein